MINDRWYKNAIVYCLSVATYMDSDGDGIGDFKGLMRRLDYLQRLGITALWLMPFQPISYPPSRPGDLLSIDHGMPNPSGAHRIVLEPYGYRWYRVGGLQNIMRRIDV